MVFDRAFVRRADTSIPLPAHFIANKTWNIVGRYIVSFVLHILAVNRNDIEWDEGHDDNDDDSNE